MDSRGYFKVLVTVWDKEMMDEARKEENTANLACDSFHLCWIQPFLDSMEL